MMKRPMTITRGDRRRAATYVVVLGGSMLVTVIGLAAVTGMRVQRRTLEMTGDFAQARLHARSAIEMGFYHIGVDSKWRTTRINGSWATKQAIGSGYYGLTVVDPADGDLSSAKADSLVLTGYGYQGDARYNLAVTLVAETQALTCLEVALHADNDLNFSSAVVRCDQTISANTSVNVGGSDMVSNVEAVNAVNGSVNGTTTTGITPRTMPDASVFDYYLTRGTAINYASLASGQISRTLLSPTNNPFGATNAEGIYYIDCAGASVYLNRVRIVGTLVLVNPGGASTIDNSIHWEPAVANYPSLLVDGNMNFDMWPDALSESSVGINLNPAGTPYNGTTDNDTSDSYPSVIKGLVYISGDVKSTYELTIDGVMVVGVSTNIGDMINLTYQSTFLDEPPPGFTDVARMVVSPGSWRRVVN